jgi:hypothetical protein
MSILSFTRKTSSGEGDIGLDGADRRSLTFTARTDVIATIDAIKAGGPFQQFSQFVDRGVTNQNLVCDGIKPKQISDLVWEVQYNFSSRPNSTQDNSQNDPLLRLPEVSWGQEEVQQVTRRVWAVVDNTLPAADWTFVRWPFVNSAGGMFPQGHTEVKHRQVLNYTRNELTFSTYWSAYYMGRVNSTSWLGDEPYQWKCKSITGQWVWETLPSGQVGYWKVAYVFVFDPDGWFDWVLDQGNYTNTLVDAVQTIREARTTKNLPMAGPILLDGAGAALSAADIAAGNFIYLTCLAARWWADFNALAITIPP